MLRTRVGYAGGSTENPTYRNLGDHIETVEIDFDPSRTSYEKLLEAFWTGHDAGARPWSRQYLSAIFYRDERQKEAAILTKEREAIRRKRTIHTAIVPFTGFYLAEAYHQKYALRGKQDLMREYEAIYPSLEGLLASTAVTKVNGYAGGYGNCETLLTELDGLGLSPEGRRRLADLVCPPAGKRKNSAAAACPVE